MLLRSPAAERSLDGRVAWCTGGELRAGGRLGTLGIRVLGIFASMAALWLAVLSVDVGASGEFLSSANPFAVDRRFECHYAGSTSSPR